MEVFIAGQVIRIGPPPGVPSLVKKATKESSQNNVETNGVQEMKTSNVIEKKDNKQAEEKHAVEKLPSSSEEKVAVVEHELTNFVEKEASTSPLPTIVEEIDQAEEEHDVEKLPSSSEEKVGVVEHELSNLVEKQASATPLPTIMGESDQTEENRDVKKLPSSSEETVAVVEHELSNLVEKEASVTPLPTIVNESDQTEEERNVEKLPSSSEEKVAVVEHELSNFVEEEASATHLPTIAEKRSPEHVSQHVGNFAKREIHLGARKTSYYHQNQVTDAKSSVNTFDYSEKEAKKWSRPVKTFYRKPWETGSKRTPVAPNPPKPKKYDDDGFELVKEKKPRGTFKNAENQEETAPKIVQKTKGEATGAQRALHSQNVLPADVKTVNKEQKSEKSVVEASADEKKQPQGGQALTGGNRGGADPEGSKKPEERQNADVAKAPENGNVQKKANGVNGTTAKSAETTVKSAEVRTQTVSKKKKQEKKTKKKQKNGQNPLLDSALTDDDLLDLLSKQNAIERQKMAEQKKKQQEEAKKELEEKKKKEALKVEEKKKETEDFSELLHEKIAEIEKKKKPIAFLTKMIPDVRKVEDLEAFLTEAITAFRSDIIEAENNRDPNLIECFQGGVVLRDKNESEFITGARDTICEAFLKNRYYAHEQEPSLADVKAYKLWKIEKSFYQVLRMNYESLFGPSIEKIMNTPALQRHAAERLFLQIAIGPHKANNFKSFIDIDQL